MAKVPIRAVDIAKVVDEAHFGTLNWLAEEPAEYGSLYNATKALLDLLEARKVDFVLAGGLAMLQYVTGRNTSDIDIVIATRELERVPELRVTYRDKDFIRSDFHGVTVDALFTRNKLFDAVRKRFTALRDFDGRTIRCATPEGLVLMKLYALPSLYRQGRFEKVRIYEADVANLVRVCDVAVAPLLEVLRSHVMPGDLTEVEGIVRDIEHAIARFDRKPFGEPREDEPEVP